TSFLLYSAEPRMSGWGSAAASAASATLARVLGLRSCPRKAASASVGRIGTRPTHPSAIEASVHVSPCIVSCTAALAVGYTGAARLKARYAPPLFLGGT